MAAYDGGGKHRLRAETAEARSRHHREETQRDPGNHQARNRWRSAIPANCPAASSSAWRWRARWWSRPETLLLDEPLSNLDANLREEMRFEIRRLLHDEYRYTTVYVTHDQSEAMTTADLIAVMNGGRIDQLGTPEEIYERPQSEFGGALHRRQAMSSRGTALDDNHVSFAGATLQVVGARLTSGQSVPVAIRQHDIQIVDGSATVGFAERGQGHRDPPGISRRQPRLHGRNLRRHRAARRHRPRQRDRQRAPTSG